MYHQQYTLHVMDDEAYINTILKCVIDWYLQYAKASLQVFLLINKFTYKYVAARYHRRYYLSNLEKFYPFWKPRSINSWFSELFKTRKSMKALNEFYYIVQRSIISNLIVRNFCAIPDDILPLCEVLRAHMSYYLKIHATMPTHGQFFNCLNGDCVIVTSSFRYIICRLFDAWGCLRHIVALIAEAHGLEELGKKTPNPITYSVIRNKFDKYGRIYRGILTVFKMTLSSTKCVCSDLHSGRFTGCNISNYTYADAHETCRLVENMNRYPPNNTHAGTFNNYVKWMQEDHTTITHDNCIDNNDHEYENN